jgi:tetratricopeptide (TPR) repeat protein
MKTFLFCCLFFSIKATFAQTIDNNLLMQYFQDQQYGNVINYLQNKLSTDSNNIKVLSLLGYASYMNDQLTEAEKCYVEILKQNSDNLTANNYLARISQRKGNDSLALTYYHKLIVLQPEKANYYNHAAILFGILQQPDSAFQYYQLAKKLNPDDAKATAALADYWIDKHQYVRADHLLIPFLQKDSTHIRIITSRIKSAFFEHQYQDIFILGKWLTDHNYVIPEPLMYVAYAYFETRQYNKCVVTTDYLAEHKILSEQMLYLAAQCYNKLKDYKKSNALLSSCLALAISDEADNYYTLMGYNYEQMHQYRAAIARFDTTHYLFHDPMKLYNIGNIYEAYLKSPKTALKYYRRYFSQAKKPETANEKEIHKYVKDRIKEMEDKK